MSKSNSGCAYGKVTRTIVENMVNEFKEFKTDIKSEFITLRKTNEDLYNHLSNRLPPWASILFALASSLITGLAIYLVSK